MKTLVCYPLGRRESNSSYYIPVGVEHIAEEAFCSTFEYTNIYCGKCGVSTVYVPHTVKSFGDQAIPLINGSIYFCGDKPGFGSLTTGSDSVRLYYVQGREGWENQSRAVVWSDSSHCKVKGEYIAPSCKEGGFNYATCERCGYEGRVFDGSSPNEDHSFDEWYTVNSSTCIIAGQNRRDCSLCDAYETVTLDLAPHKPASISEKASNCAESGWIEHYKCSICKGCFEDEGCTEVIDDVTIPTDPDNHVGATEVRDAVDATFESDGYTGDIYCLSCGEICENGIAVDKLIPGDANRDKIVNNVDLAMLQRYIAEWVGYTEETLNIPALDLDMSGSVTVEDSAIIARYLSGWVGYEVLPIRVA